MPILKSVLGLDLGTHTIKAVELRQTMRGLEPVQMRVHPRAAPDAPLPELLQRFVRMHQLPTDRVVASIPGSRLSVRRMDFPFRDRKRLDAAVPFEVEGETPFDLDDVVVDWETVGGERGHAEVVVCIAPRRAVAERLQLLRDGGCEPRVLEAEGLVLANLARPFGWQGSRLVIDLGHSFTTFCVLREGRPIAARTVGIGGHHLSEAIANDQAWSYEDAEHAKCEDGIFHLGFESASPHAVAVLDRIAREAIRMLEGSEAALGGAAASTLAGVTLVGGTSRLHRLDEYLSERLGVEARRPDVPPEGEGAALLASGDPALFAHGLALALRGTSAAQTHIDFRKDDFAWRTDLRQYLGRDLRPTAVLLGIVALLGVASAATSISLESRRADATRAEVERIYRAVRPDGPLPANPVRALSEELRAARERADFLGVYGGNLSALDLLSEISRRVPTDLNVRFEEVQISGRVVRIKVAARSFEAAERLVRELAVAPPFESAEVKGGIERTKAGTRFTVAISLNAGEEAAR